MTNFVKGVMQSRGESLAKAIRRFRTECALTQAQFASAINLAPTSIYRYEAGTNEPEVRVLKKLHDFAKLQKVPWAKDYFFSQMLRQLGISDKELIALATRVPLSGRESSLHCIEVEGTVLTPQERLTVLAATLLLRHSTDAIDHKLLNTLLERWMPSAIAEYQSNHTKEMFKNVDSGSVE